MNVQPLTDETLVIAPKSQPQNEMIFLDPSDMLS